MTITIYGIKNCDTMKKARAWLDQQASIRLPRLQGRRGSTARARSMGDELGWETLLNRAGTTFRNLPEADKDGFDAEGDRADAGAALDDQAAGARHRRQAACRLFAPDTYSAAIAPR